MSCEWQSEEELFVSGDGVPVEHSPDVPPGFAAHAWVRDGGTCSICRRPGLKVVYDKCNPNHFKTVCEVHAE